jgi:hypothetical protein
MSDSQEVQLDWRLQSVSSLAEDFTSPYTGVTHKAGAAVTVAGTIRYDKTRIVQFYLPNMTALLLDQAYVSWAASKILLEEEQFQPSTSQFAATGTLLPKDIAAFYSLVEQRMVAIVFAYTALESFANESIPDDYICEQKRDDKRCTEVYDKDQAEFLSLDTKLALVLPPIYGVVSPRGTNKTWDGYLKIKRIRDRIIHVKSKDKQSSGPDDSTIWNELLKTPQPNIALAARDIIGYYLKTVKEKPRWFTMFPHKL